MRSLKSIVCIYLVCFLTFSVLTSISIYFVLDIFLINRKAQQITALKENLIIKQKYYLNHSSDYNLIFFGDSRSFCGFDTEIMDSLLRTRSINLSHWATWFPVQYPYLEKLLSNLPQGSKVIWSLGHQNFKSGEAKTSLIYPIGFLNLPKYLNWGFTFREISDNYFYSMPPTFVYGARNNIKIHLNELYDQAFFQIKNTQKPNIKDHLKLKFSDEFDAFKKFYINNPHYLSIEPVTSHDTITSIEIYKSGGNYLRVELCREFFTRMQKELGSKHIKNPDSDIFLADKKYWNCFLAILELFRKNNIDLIVNEFEEAPYNYTTSGDKLYYRNFMKKVRSVVEKNGFKYVCIDWDKLTNDDYFDYNHLNSTGVSKFSELFAKEYEKIKN